MTDVSLLLQCVRPTGMDVVLRDSSRSPRFAGSLCAGAALSCCWSLHQPNDLPSLLQELSKIGVGAIFELTKV